MQQFSRFLLAHGANTLSVGIQIVMVAWLAVAELRLPASELGWVQAALLIPNVGVLLWAGFWVERANAAWVLQGANAGLMIVHGLFAYALWGHQVTFVGLLIYAVGLGALNAVIQNARETLLGRFSKTHTLQKNISSVTVVQFASQALGVALGVVMHWLDAASLVLMQALLCAFAMVCYGGTNLLRVGQSNEASTDNCGLVQTLKAIAQLKALRTVLLLVAFNGLMHMGMFLVLLPLMATQWLGFQALGYVALQLTFIVGSIVVSGRLMMGPPVAHPGQHVMFAALYSGVIGFALAAGPTPFGLFALIFCWGVVAGGSANLCRVVAQSLAPESMRARVMGLYQFALFGCAPFGALLAGYLVHLSGMPLALKTLGACSVAVFILSLLQKELWQFTPVQNRAETQ